MKKGPQLVKRSQTQAHQPSTSLNAEYHGERPSRAAFESEETEEELRTSAETNVPEHDAEGSDPSSYRDTPYGACHKHLCTIIEIIDKNEDVTKTPKNAVETLHESIDPQKGHWYHWYWDQEGLRQVSLYGLSYLAESNNKNFSQNVVDDIHRLLVTREPALDKISIELAVMTLSFKIIHRSSLKEPEKYQEALIKSLDFLVHDSKNNQVSYFPAIVVGLLAKTVLGVTLKDSEVDILQEVSISIPDKNALKPSRLFSYKVRNKDKVKSDPTVYYSDDIKYYMNEALFSEGEINHIINTLFDSWKVPDRLEQAKLMSLLLRQVISGQKVTTKNIEKLLELSKQKKRGHITNFYNGVLIGVLLNQAHDYHYDIKFNKFRDAIHQVLSPWRSYAIKAYYNHIRLQKRSRSAIKLNVTWQSLLTYWHDNGHAESKNIIIKLLDETKDINTLSQFSIEPECCESTLKSWLEAAKQKRRLSSPMLRQLEKILRQYTDNLCKKGKSKANEPCYTLEHIKQVLRIVRVILNTETQTHSETKQIHFVGNPETKELLLNITQAIKKMMDMLLSNDDFQSTLQAFALDIFIKEAKVQRQIFSSMFDSALLVNFMDLLEKNIRVDEKVCREISAKGIEVLSLIIKHQLKDNFIQIFNEKLYRKESIFFSPFNHILSAYQETAVAVIQSGFSLLEALTSHGFLLPTVFLKNMSQIIIKHRKEEDIFTLLNLAKKMIEHPESHQTTALADCFLSELPQLLLHPNKAIGESTCFLIRKILKNHSLDRQSMDTFLNYIHNEILGNRALATRHHAVSFSTEWLRILAEKKYPLSLESLDCIRCLNKRLSSASSRLYARIMHLNALIFANQPIVDATLFTLLSEFYQSDANVLQNQMDVLTGMLKAENAACKRLDIKDSLSIRAAEYFLDDNYGYRLKEKSLQLLKSISSKRALPKGLVFELLRELNHNEEDVKGLLLSILGDQLRLTPQLTDEFNQYENKYDLLLMLFSALTCDKLIDLSLSALASLSSVWQLNTEQLELLADLVFHYPQVEIRKLALEVLEKQSLQHATNKVKTVLELEKRAKSLNEDLREADLHFLDQHIRAGHPLTLNVLEGMDSVFRRQERFSQDSLITGKQPAPENSAAAEHSPLFTPFLELVSRLAKQKHDYVKRWINPLMMIYEKDYARRKQCILTLAAILEAHTVHDVAPFKMIIDYVCGCTTLDASRNESLLNAIVIGLYKLNANLKQETYLELFNFILKLMMDDPASEHGTLRLSALKRILLRLNQESVLSNVTSLKLIEEAFTFYIERSTDCDETLRFFKTLLILKIPKEDNRLNVLMARASQILDGYEQCILIKKNDVQKVEFDTLNFILGYAFIRSAPHVIKALKAIFKRPCYCEEDKLKTLKIMIRQYNKTIIQDKSFLIVLFNLINSENEALSKSAYRITNLWLLNPSFASRVDCIESLTVWMRNAIDERRFKLFIKLLANLYQKGKVQSESLTDEQITFYQDVCSNHPPVLQSGWFVNKEALSNSLPYCIVLKLLALHFKGEIENIPFFEWLRKGIPSLTEGSKHAIIQHCLELATCRGSDSETFHALLVETVNACKPVSLSKLIADFSNLTEEQLKIVSILCHSRVILVRSRLIVNLLHQIRSNQDPHFQLRLLHVLGILAQSSHFVGKPEYYEVFLDVLSPGYFSQLTAMASSIASSLRKFNYPTVQPSVDDKALRLKVHLQIIRLLHRFSVLDNVAISTAERLFEAVMRVSHDVLGANFVTLLKKRVEDLSLEIQLKSLFAIFAYALTEETLSSDAHLGELIEEKILASFPAEIDNAVITRFRDLCKERYADDTKRWNTLNLLAGKMARYRWTTKELDLLIRLFEQEREISTIPMDMQQFIRQCEADIELSWVKSLLERYAHNTRTISHTLTHAAKLAVDIGFDLRTLLQFVDKVPATQQDGSVLTSRHAVISLFEFIQQYHAEVYFFTVILPRTRVEKERSPIAQWIDEMQAYVLRRFIMTIRDKIDQKQLSTPRYEVLVDINALVSNCLKLVKNQQIQFSELYVQLQAYDNAIERFTPPMYSDPHFSDTPHLNGLYFALQFCLDYRVTSIHLLDSIIDLNKKNYANSKGHELSIKALKKPFLQLNGNNPYTDEIVNKMMNVIQLATAGTLRWKDSELINTWKEEDIRDWAKERLQEKTPFDDVDEACVLAILLQACKQVCGFDIRDAQCLAFLSLVYAKKEKGRFIQVATGEGKTIIIAMLAIWFALQGRKIDIVTSSPILAKRDAENKEQQRLYQSFNLKVSHNEEDAHYIEGIKPCYQDDVTVVYGSMSNFQFDVLRHEASELKTRGNRGFDLIIIDEVDNLLIDEGSKVAMLADPMPAMNYLNGLFIRIYKEVQRFFIDFQHRANNTSYEAELTQKLDEEIDGWLNEEKEDRLCIPNHLKAYVNQQKRAWARSAVLAFLHQENREYVIVADSTLRDRIAPVDYLNTGITQLGTHWGDGLHQFLEIKHGLSISSESILTKYLSNVAFIKRYIKSEHENSILGMTGTLGSKASKALLSDIYQIDYLRIPTHKAKQFKQLPEMICDDTPSWHNAVVLDSLYQASLGRIVLVLCETIAAANQFLEMIHEHEGDIDVYDYITSDANHFIAEKQYQPKTIIVATNLAGRGTDIQLAKDVIDVGGLHVIFTFLPSNLRVERQGFGRAARKGEPGTGKFILNREDVLEKFSDVNLKDLNQSPQPMELLTRLRNDDEKEDIQRIREKELPKIEFKDLLFSHYQRLLLSLKEARVGVIDKANRSYLKEEHKTMRSALEERWGFWLKQVDYSKLDDLKSDDTREELMQCVEKQFAVFKKAFDQDIQNECFIQNPCYYITLGNSLVQRLEDWWDIGARYDYTKFCDAAIACYQKAMELDKDFSFIAHYNLSYVCLLQKQEGYPKVVRELLETADGVITEHMSQLQRTQHIYCQHLAANVKSNLAHQLEQEAEAFNVLRESMANALHMLTKQQNPFSLKVNSAGKEHHHFTLTHDDLVNQSNQYKEEHAKFFLTFDDLQPRHDIGVPNTIENIVNTVTELKGSSNEYELIFDTKAVPSHLASQLSLRKLLPINRKGVEEVHQGESSRTPDQGDSGAPSDLWGKTKRYGEEGLKLGAKGAQMVFAIPEKVDRVAQRGYEWAQDWRYGREEASSIPVHLEYYDIPTSIALALLNALREEIEIELSFKNLSGAKVKDRLTTFKDEKKCVILKSERQSNSVVHTRVTADQLEMSKKTHYTLIITCHDRTKLTEALNALKILSADERNQITFMGLAQSRADELMKIANQPLRVLFPHLNTKQARSVAGLNDTWLTGAKCTVNALSREDVCRLVEKMVLSTGDFRSSSQFIDRVLIENGFEQADIESYKMNGYLFFYQTMQRQYTPIRRILLKGGLGAIQVAGGATLVACTGGLGLAAGLGMVAMGEGIMDVMSATRGTYSGEMNFEGYVGQKVFGYGLGVATLGVLRGYGHIQHLRKLKALEAAGVTGEALAKMTQYGGEILSQGIVSQPQYINALGHVGKSGARKVVMAGTSTGIGVGTGFVLSGQEKKVAEAVRLLVKTAIHDPALKHFLVKIFAHDRIRRNDKNRAALQHLIAIKLREINYILLINSYDTIGASFESRFATCCEEIAEKLHFRDLLAEKLMRQVSDEKLNNIIRELKQYNMLSEKDEIDIKKLLPGDMVYYRGMVVDFEKHPIAFESQHLKTLILQVCFDYYQACQEEYFSDKNALVKYFSDNLSQQMMQQMHVVASIAQVGLNFAANALYEVAEAKIASKFYSSEYYKRYEEWLAEKQGAEVDHTKQVFTLEVVENEMTYDNLSLEKLKEVQSITTEEVKMEVVKIIKYPPVKYPGSNEYRIEEITFQNGAKYTRNIYTESIAYGESLVDGSRLVLSKNDAGMLAKGYHLFSHQHDIMAGTSMGSAAMASAKSSTYNAKCTTSNLDSTQKPYIPGRHGLLPTGTSELTNIFSTQFILDSQRSRYLIQARNELHRKYFNRHNQSIKLIQDAKGKQTLQVGNKKRSIPLPKTNTYMQRIEVYPALWVALKDLIKQLETTGVIEEKIYDEKIGPDPNQQLAHQETLHVKEAIERAQSQVDHKHNHNSNIAFACFLQRVNQASLHLLSDFSSWSIQYQCLLNTLNHDKMLDVWVNTYDDALHHVAQMIRLLMIMIIGNMGDLAKQFQKHDTEKCIELLEQRVDECFFASLIAGYAEQSQRIFMEHLHDYAENFALIEELAEELYSKFVYFHRLRFEKHRMELQYKMPILPAGYFKAMQREELHQAVKNLTGLMFKKEGAYMAGVYFTRATNTPFGGMVGCLLSQLGTFHDEERKTTELVEKRRKKFMENVIKDFNTHQSLIPEVLINNEKTRIQTVLIRNRDEAIVLSKRGEELNNLMQKLLKKEISREAFQNARNELNALQKNYQTTIQRYREMMKTNGGYRANAFDKKLLEHLQAKQLIIDSMLKMLNNKEDVDLYTALKNQVRFHDESSNTEKRHVVEGESATSANQGAPYVGASDKKDIVAIDFNYADALKASHANIFYDDYPKLAVLLQHPRRGELIQKDSAATLPTCTPMEVLRLPISKEAKALILHQTLSMVCYRKEVIQNNVGQNHLAFYTKFSSAGILTMLGITREEIRYFLLHALNDRERERHVKACLATAIKAFLKKQMEEGSYFERAFHTANLMFKWQMLKDKLPNDKWVKWNEPEKIANDIVFLQNVLAVEYDKMKDNMTSQDNEAWNTYQDEIVKIRILDAYSQDKMFMHELHIRYNHIAKRLKEGLLLLVGETKECQFKQRLNALLTVSSKQLWTNIPKKLVVAYCQQSQEEWLRAYFETNTTFNLEKMLEVPQLLIHFIDNYLSNDRAEYDDMIKYLLNHMRSPCIFANFDYSQNHLCVDLNENLAIAKMNNQGTEDWVLLCRCDDPKRISELESFNLPIRQISHQDPRYDFCGTPDEKSLQIDVEQASAGTATTFFAKKAKGMTREKSEIAHISSHSPQQDRTQANQNEAFMHSDRGHYSGPQVDNHWYSDEEIITLIKHYIEGKPDVDCLEPMLGTNWMGQHNTLRDNLVAYNQERARTLSRGGSVRDRILMPVNLKGGHWALLYVIYPQDMAQLPAIYYFDPKGKEPPQDLRDAILDSRVFPHSEIINVGYRVQQDDYHCGPWVVEAAKAIANHGAIPEQGYDINGARMEHAKIRHGTQSDAKDSSENRKMNRAII